MIVSLTAQNTSLMFSVSIREDALQPEYKTVNWLSRNGGEKQIYFPAMPTHGVTQLRYNTTEADHTKVTKGSMQYVIDGVRASLYL